MIVGFFGIQCGSSNKGVSALAYSAISIFDKLIKDEAKFILFTSDSNHDIQIMKNSLKIRNKDIISQSYTNRSLASISKLSKTIKKCDCIIDFTGGDSFSDIYGVKRLFIGLFTKQIVLNSNIPLILAPQTYGPFYNKRFRPWIKNIINKSEIVFLRDEKSKEILDEITKKTFNISTDVAFSLPWNNNEYNIPKNINKRIGINISGLLWNGGYTQNNQFNLETNYQMFCKGIIEYLINNKQYEIYLIPHVITPKKNSLENDVSACENLIELYPTCKLSPIFETPIQAKSFISQMDLFIGARMHSTIAAFSTNVPTIPVAYSRKFSGLYQNLNYDVLLDLSVMKTEETIQKAINYIENKDELKNKVILGNNLAQKKLSMFTVLMKEYLKELNSPHKNQERI